MTVFFDAIMYFENVLDSEVSIMKSEGYIFRSFEDWEKTEKDSIPDYEKLDTAERQKKYKESIYHDYFNWRQRFIPCKKRKIIYGPNFTRIPEYERGLELLENKIKNGEDINPHLSRQILHPESNDGMLFDFGITHLHLGERMDPRHPTLIEGREKVLYVYIDDDVAVFICIDSHGKWADSRLLEDLDQVYHKALQPYKIQGEPLFTLNDEERKQLRNVNINTAVEINGGSYMSIGGGITGIGSSVNGILDFTAKRRYYNNLNKRVYNWFKENINYIINEKKISGDIVFDKYDLGKMIFIDTKRNIELKVTSSSIDINQL